MSKWIPLIGLMLLSVAGFSQIKYEKEERIKRDDAPSNAVRFVDALQLSGKIKWFKEIGYKTISFEAKTKHQGKRLSVEFSKDGLFEDAEVEIKTADIEPATLSAIKEYLRGAHNTFKINKVQRQYSGDTSRIRDYFLGKADTKNLIINYELVFTTKTEGVFARYEYLFDKNGVVLQKSRITSRMTDNLEF